MTQKQNMIYFLQTESSENRSKCPSIPETPTCRKAIAEVQQHMQRDAMAEEREDLNGQVAFAAWTWSML